MVYIEKQLFGNDLGRRVTFLALIGVVLWIEIGRGQEPDESDSITGKDETREVNSDSQPSDGRPSLHYDLAIDQGRLADRYKRLEQVMLRLAELTASTNPRRATLLRQAIAKSKEREISVQFEEIVMLLEQQRLAVAVKDQAQLKQELDRLLQLLLKESRAERVESERRRIRRYLKQINRLIKEQRGLKARTEAGDNNQRLAEAQGKTANRTRQLADKVARDQAQHSNETAPNGASPNEEDPSESQDPSQDSQDGNQGSPKDSESPEGKKDGDAKPSESGRGNKKGQPGSPNPTPGQSRPNRATDEQDDSGKEPKIPSAQKRVASAHQQMKQAQENLQEALDKQAVENQQQAMEELEQAKAELERILRQLREEEIQQMLVMLEARFRKMLELQLEVFEGTVRLDSVPVDQRDHDEEIEAGRLSRQEGKIVIEADHAMALLREEGSSVAFPEAVEQLRDDMQQVVRLLSQGDVGQLTQEIEQEIIRALEETIEALRKTLRDMEKKQQFPQGAPQSGEPQDPPLVDKLAELRMIRSLQVRINRRTERYRKLVDGRTTVHAELLRAIQQLAVRQQRIQRATKDLHLGRNR